MQKAFLQIFEETETRGKKVRESEESNSWIDLIERRERGRETEIRTASEVKNEEDGWKYKGSEEGKQNNRTINENHEGYGMAGICRGEKAR